MSVIQEIHDSDCENHEGGRSLAHKAINQGYYWSKMFDDTKEHAKKCPQYQRFAHFQTDSARTSTLCRVPGPSCSVGVDVLGPLRHTQPQFRFLLVATDYFTK